MTSDPTGHDRHSMRGRGWLFLLGLFYGLERTGSSDSPVVVRGGPEIEAVLDCAGEFAAENREDREAVAAVRASAKNARTLTLAARASRFQGRHHEYEHQNRVFRLVEAARTGADVAPVTPEDRVRIDAVSMLARLAPSEQWSLLAEREPALRHVEQDARSGAFGHQDNHHEPAGTSTGRTSICPDGRRTIQMQANRTRTDDDAEGQEHVDDTEKMLELRRRVQPLLGRDRRNRDDPLLCTTYAAHIAMAHLVNLRPAPPTS